MRKSHLPWNWRSRVEITRGDDPEDSDLLVFNLTFKEGQTPKGFKRCIGELVVWNHRPYLVEQSGIKDYFVRRGLGTLLYLHALNQLGSLSTHYASASVSEAAKGLWRRLVKRTHNHRADFFAGTLTVFKQSRSHGEVG